MKQITLISILALLLSCKTKSVIAPACDTFGTAKDYSRLDGCGFLIELENGDLLNPVKGLGAFELKDQQALSFSYKKMPDMMSVCMREKTAVEITCIQEAGRGGSCADTSNPFEVDWMDRAIDIHNPNQILKFKVDKEWAYLFRSIPDSYLYDCKGTLICESKNDHDDCFTNHLSKLGKGKIIWQGEGVWD